MENVRRFRQLLARFSDSSVKSASGRDIRRAGNAFRSLLRCASRSIHTILFSPICSNCSDSADGLVLRCTPGNRLITGLCRRVRSCSNSSIRRPSGRAPRRTSCSFRYRAGSARYGLKPRTDVRLSGNRERDPGSFNRSCVSPTSSCQFIRPRIFSSALSCIERLIGA